MKIRCGGCDMKLFVTMNASCVEAGEGKTPRLLPFQQSETTAVLRNGDNRSGYAGSPRKSDQLSTRLLIVLILLRPYKESIAEEPLCPL
ncbi:hypothetical protein Trydic_g5254 [Trypoxylus dichotomus]